MLLFFLFIIGFMVSFLVEKLTLNLVNKYSIYNNNNNSIFSQLQRSNLGGIGIFVGFFSSLYIIFLVIFLFENPQHYLDTDFNLFQIMLYLCSIIFCFLLGFYDDLKKLTPLQKLAVELIIASILFYIGFKIEYIRFPLLADVIELGVLSYPITLLWIIGIVNAINLIDGLDGLAGGIVVIASITLLIYCLIANLIFPLIIIVALLGATLGFLPYNIFPSKILMGDSGSLFSGLILATISLKTSHKSSLGIALLIPLIYLAIPVMDITLSLIRRLIKKQNPFQKDKDHIHHRLMRKGFSEKNTVKILLVLTIIFSGLSILVYYGEGIFSLLGLLISILLGILFMGYLGYLNFKSINEKKS